MKKAEACTHSVYVVRLDDAIREQSWFQRENPELRDDCLCLYVGMTGLSPAERFANHRSGHKSSRVVHRYGLELMPALFEHLNPMPYAVAVEMERDLAEDLREEGHGVWQR